MRFSKKEEIYQKINIHFFIIAFAVAIGVFITLADKGKYISRSVILLLPKNEKTAVHVDKVRGNIVSIFEKQSELSDAEISISSENTLIEIESRNHNKSDAIELSETTSQEIINIASDYYNVKNDLGLRIIKDRIQREENNIFTIIILSIVIGGVISFIVQIIVSTIEKLAIGFVKKRKNVFDMSRDIEDVLAKNKSKIEKLSYHLPQEKKIVTGDIPVDEVKEIAHGNNVNFKKASSPQNLPVEPSKNMKDSDAFEADENGIDLSNSQETSREPTEEEYRERLNQLLQGE